MLDWGLALLVGVWLVTPAFAAEESKELRTGEEAILAALDEKTSIEFIDEPLSSVVDHFREVHRIEIQIDVRALEDVNQGTDTPITKRIQNVTFRSALKSRIPRSGPDVDDPGRGHGNHHAGGGRVALDFSSCDGTWGSW